MGFGYERDKESRPKNPDETAINASIAHVILSCVAGQGINHWNELNFSLPGMHGNLFLFGILGYLHNQSARFQGLNITSAYGVSTKATRYLPIPCMMADLHKGNHLLGGLHLLSGLVPFSMSMIGTSLDSAQVGNLVIAGNIISLGHYSLENNLEWGCYTAGAAIFTYYLCPQMGPKIMYPIGLALMEYSSLFGNLFFYSILKPDAMGEEDIHAALAHVVLGCVAGPTVGHIHTKSFTHPGMHANLLVHGVVGFLHYYKGLGDVSSAYKVSLAASRYLPIPCLMADITRDNDAVSLLHLLSGVVPFVIAVSGKEDRHFGDLMVACNIVALVFHSYDRNREWGWYTAGAACLSYFAAPQIGAFGPKVIYPLALALMDYCGYRLYGSGRAVTISSQ